MVIIHPKVKAKNTCLSTCKNVVINNELRYVKRRQKQKNHMLVKFVFVKLAERLIQFIDMELLINELLFIVLLILIMATSSHNTKHMKIIKWRCKAKSKSRYIYLIEVRRHVGGLLQLKSLTNLFFLRNKNQTITINLLVCALMTILNERISISC